MMIKDFFKLAFENILHRKVRSWLTIIGIVIGIAAVVALVSLGQGVKKVITDEFASLGTDKIFVQAGAGFGGGGTQSTDILTEHDVDVIERVSGVKQTSSMLFKAGKVEFKRNSYYVFVVGVPIDDSLKLLDEAYNLEYASGRSLKSGDKYKVVIGSDVASGETFDRVVAIGDSIVLEGVDFEVVGVLKKTGDPDFDGSINIPKDIAQDIFNTEEETMVLVQTQPGVDPEKVAEEIKRVMRRDRNLEEGYENFNVQTSTQLLESFGIILDALTAIVIGVAAISLFVGGVGIMNTMYTAVLQRTNEIGVMKAIGAKNSHIMGLFLIESGVLGLIGGAIGILLGMGLSKIIEFIGRTFLDTILLSAYFSWYLILGALLFAFVIGALSGLLPARQASKLKPVDALRYE